MAVILPRFALARLVSLCSVCVLVCVLLAPPPSAAQGPVRNPTYPQRDRIVLPTVDVTQALPDRAPARTYDALRVQARAAQPTTLIIELREPAVAAVAEAAPANANATRVQIARVQSAQYAAEAAMRAAGISYRVIFAPQRVFSGLIIEAAPNQLDAIKALPGVADAYPAGVGILANDSSVPFLGVPLVWASGYRGQNVRIGVIDTGIDYEHADFGGTGPGTGFPTAKVEGGRDFVGDTWHPDTNPTLQPDADPMDQQGHGTHMAGTIAGFGVDGGGNTYGGPWDTTTPFTTMTIGPGMAPQATLYALKVGANHTFVSEAGTIAALEWAVDPDGDGNFADRLDVVNLSLGTAFGNLDRGWTVAADNAAQIGVVVVAAAVNIQDFYFSQGDPATAPHVISVGQSNDDDNGGPAADTLAALTARGPQRNPNAGLIALKPDIVAPGIQVFSADAGTVSGGVSTGATGGTSTGAAHVTGMMALLREAYPGWTAAELKALVMNTAIHDLFSGNNFGLPAYGPARVGAGRLDAVNALASPVIAFNTANPELVSVSFGLLNVVTATTFEKTITVVNKGNSPQTYDVAYVPMVYADDGNDDPGTPTPGIGDGGPGVVMSVSPAQITVGPGATATLTVTLTVDPARMTQPYTHDPTVGEIFPLYFRHWLAEESGYVTLTPVVTGAVLRVPVYAAPRPAATMQAAAPTLLLTGQQAGTAHIMLTGTDVYTGPNQPYDETSLVSAFTLWDTSPALPGLTGFQPSADLHHLGVASSYLAVGANLSATWLFFGISTHGEWASLATTTTEFEIYIDVDQDGTADYQLGHFGFAGGADSYLTYVRDLTTGTVSVQDFVNYNIPIGAFNLPNTALFQTNVAFFPMSVAAIAELVPGDATFDFWVAGWYNQELIDLSGVMTYNVEALGLDLASGAAPWGATLYNDWDGATVDVAYDWAQYAGPSPACVLLLHHHNVPGMRAETVCFQPEDEPTPNADTPVGPAADATSPTPEADLLPATGYSPPAEPAQTGSQYLPHGLWIGLAIGVTIMVGALWRRARRSEVRLARKRPHA